MEAFPLHWPEGWRREHCQETSRFETSATKAYSLLMAEIQRMGGTDVILSTNVPVKKDGIIRMDREPVDPGVAVYFTRKGKAMVFACDRFDVIRDNIYSIAKTIDALRGIERWGASDMMERAFTGFKQLTAGENWWNVLEVDSSASLQEIATQYRILAKTAHPDHGGSQEQMARLNVALNQAKKARA